MQVAPVNIVMFLSQIPFLYKFQELWDIVFLNTYIYLLCAYSVKRIAI